MEGLVESPGSGKVFVPVAIQAALVSASEMGMIYSSATSVNLESFEVFPAIFGGKLDANEYQHLCERTAGGDNGDRIAYTAMGLSGEAGEVLDETKKLLYHNHPHDLDKFLKELGDVAWYLAMCSRAHGFTLSEVMEANIKKLRERYPEGFTTEASINRKT